MAVTDARNCRGSLVSVLVAVILACMASLLLAGPAEALELKDSGGFHSGSVEQADSGKDVQKADVEPNGMPQIAKKGGKAGEGKVAGSSLESRSPEGGDGVINDEEKGLVLVAQSARQDSTESAVEGEMNEAMVTGAKLLTAQSAAAPNSGKGDLAPGEYFIASAVDSCQLVDVCGSSKGNGANVIAWRGSGTANQQWSITIDKDGYAVITSINSGKVLDVAQSRAVRGANVIQYQAGNSQNQKWIIEKYGDAYVLISALNNSLVLDLTRGSAANGTNVEIWTRNNTKNQLFKFISVTSEQALPGSCVLNDGVYTLKALSAENTVVDVEGGSTANGANALTWSASGAAWQAWYLAYDNAGYYTITSVNSGFQLAPAAIYGIDGINVGQYSLGNADRAKWRVSESNGQYALVNKATGTSLNAALFNGNSANVQMGSGSQMFMISPQAVIPTGSVAIEVGVNTKLALDVYGGSMAEGAKLGTWDEYGTLNQRYLLAEYGNGYTIRPFNSRMYLTASAAGVLTQEAARANMQNQVWSITASWGLVTIVNATTGKAITISGNATRASATVGVDENADNSIAQKFYLRSVPAVSDGTYYICLSSDSGMVLDVTGGSRKNNANLELWQRGSSNNQRFTFTALDSGLYKIANVATARVLDVSGASTKTGANVAMYKWHGGANQRWRIEFNADFTLKITNAQTGYSLDTANSSAVKGANVIVSAVNAASPTQKFWITETEYGAEVVQIGVPCCMQNPELPTGCESVALTNALLYYGYSLGKTTIASSYMPYGSGGVYDFIGNPYDYSGWIICAPGITDTANDYLSQAGGGVAARNITGTSLAGLRSYLDRGQPVVVWTTIGMGEPGDVEAYRSGYPLRSNNHTVVLTGYNPFNGSYQVADSLDGTVWRNGDRFEYLYNAMGKQAVVLEA